jgi:hypothetical protein
MFFKVGSGRGRRRRRRRREEGTKGSSIHGLSETSPSNSSHYSTQPLNPKPKYFNRNPVRIKPHTPPSSGQARRRRRGMESIFEFPAAK